VKVGFQVSGLGFPGNEAVFDSPPEGERPGSKSVPSFLETPKTLRISDTESGWETRGSLGNDLEMLPQTIFSNHLW
jgi:hypothetical protein